MRAKELEKIELEIEVLVGLVIRIANRLEASWNVGRPSAP